MARKAANVSRATTVDDRPTNPVADELNEQVAIACMNPAFTHSPHSRCVSISSHREAHVMAGPIASPERHASHSSLTLTA